MDSKSAFASERVAERLSLSDLQVTNLEQSRKLSMREITADGGFVKTINCFSSQVTIIDANEASKLKPFRDSLSGEPMAECGVQLRLGSREPATSEIFAAHCNSSNIATMTVEDALSFSGAAKRQINSILDRFGLSVFRNKTVSSLDPCAAKRVTIAGSLCTSANIVYLDDPFADISHDWIEPLAEILLELAVASKKIVIISGLAYCPVAWRDNESVRIESVDRTRQRKSSFGAKLEDMPNEISALRAMLHDGRQAEDDGRFFYTRPIRVTRLQQVSPQEDVLQAEAISNPEFGSSIGEANQIAESPAQTARSKSRRKRTLTGVTKVERVRRRMHWLKATFSLVSLFKLR